MLAKRLELLFAGEFSMEPSELVDSGWPAPVGSAVVAPEGAPLTCIVGGREIDYFVVSHRARTFIQGTDTRAVPWGPHVGVTLVLRGKPWYVLTREFVRAATLDGGALWAARDIGSLPERNESMVLGAILWCTGTSRLQRLSCPTPGTAVETSSLFMVAWSAKAAAVLAGATGADQKRAMVRGRLPELTLRPMIPPARGNGVRMVARKAVVGGDQL